jgi:hypothetical protein
VEIPTQLSDHNQLLVVLLAEDGYVWSHQAEELGHHCGHAGEKIGTISAAQIPAEMLNHHAGLEPRRIYLRALGSEDRIYPHLPAKSEIALQIPGILV